MAITVVGHVTKDTLIFPHSGWRVVNALGGTMYTASALASLLMEPIRLVCNVGEDTFDWVLTSLKQFPNIDTSGIQKINGNHFHCHILFLSEYGTQYDEGTEKPITFSQVKPFLNDSAFVLVSPMTGFDLKLRTLEQIKENATCPVYLDYHMLALDRDSLGNRFLRRRKNWFEWCTCCDHLQLNQFEAESLSLFHINTEVEMLRFSEPILRNGVKSVAVTLGENGSFVCFRKDARDFQVERIKSNPVPLVVDTTGCGDVFASGFISSFLHKGDLLEAYKFANNLAALKCGFDGFDGLANGLRSIPKS